MDYRKAYEDLQADLKKLEKQHDLYLADPCVDAENAGSADDYAALYRSACAVAGCRAEEAGMDINALLGRIIF